MTRTNGTTKVDSNSPDYLVHEIRLTTPIPSIIPGLIGDAVCNLRAALDQAMYVIVASVHGPIRNAYFPIATTLRGFENSFTGWGKKIPRTFARFSTLKPYRGGNDILWGLNEIRNRDAHAIITPIGIGCSDIAYRVGDSFFAMPQDPVWDCSEKKITFMTIPIDGEFDYKYNFKLHVAFSQIEVIEGKPVVPVLDQMARHVESVVFLLENEARRFGIVK